MATLQRISVGTFCCGTSRKNRLELQPAGQGDSPSWCLVQSKGTPGGRSVRELKKSPVAEYKGRKGTLNKPWVTRSCFSGQGQGRDQLYFQRNSRVIRVGQCLRQFGGIYEIRQKELRFKTMKSR